MPKAKEDKSTYTYNISYKAIFPAYNYRSDDEFYRTFLTKKNHF